MRDKNIQITDEKWAELLPVAVQHFMNCAHITRLEYLRELAEVSEQASDNFFSDLLSKTNLTGIANET